MSEALLASLLPLPVALPIAGAVAAPLVVRVWRRLPVLIGVATLAGSLAVLLMLVPAVFAGRPYVHFMGHWTPVQGHALGIAFAADPFGLVFALLVAVVGGLLLIYSLSELGGLGARELGAYTALFMLLLAALIGSALTADLFNLFVWFEVAALASYGLTGFFLERPIALEAAFKILVLTTVASFGVFIGSGMLYAEHGALNFGQLHQALAHGPKTPDIVALALLVAGYATKAGLVPFHGWLADAHTAAPGPVSAMFSGLMVNLGIVAVARIAYQIYGGSRLPILGVLMVIGLVSALAGAVLALAQDDLKRLLAYDTVSQMGVLTAGFAVGSAAGAAGATYHLVNHGLFKALLFLCAGALVHRTGATKLSDMGGLARRMPVVTVAFVIGVAAIAGIAPLNGYVSLSLIHHALEQRHEAVPLAILMVAQVVTIAAFAKAAWMAFFRRPDREHEWRERPRAGMIFGFGGLAAGCLAFGVLGPQALHRVMSPAAGGLLDPSGYAHAVLTRSGRLPIPAIPFNYLDPPELLTMIASLGVGVLLALAYLRIREPAPIRVLRGLHDGSVNAYATWVAAGIVLLAASLKWM